MHLFVDMLKFDTVWTTKYDQQSRNQFHNLNSVMFKGHCSEMCFRNIYILRWNLVKTKLLKRLCVTMKWQLGLNLNKDYLVSWWSRVLFENSRVMHFPIDLFIASQLVLVRPGEKKLPRCFTVIFLCKCRLCFSVVEKKPVWHLGTIQTMRDT